MLTSEHGLSLMKLGMFIALLNTLSRSGTDQGEMVLKKKKKLLWECSLYVCNSGNIFEELRTPGKGTQAARMH